MLSKALKSTRLVHVPEHVLEKAACFTAHLFRLQYHNYCHYTSNKMPEAGDYVVGQSALTETEQHRS